MKRLPGLFFSLVFVTLTAWGQRTDLSGLKFCIDPGHGGNNPANDRYLVPDPGTEFWESESNFQKALRLDTLLKAQGAWVILTRYTNSYPADDEPSLSARWQLANANNVNWFHSIHSNATGWTSNTTVNYTLLLVKEDIPTRQAVWPQAVTMSNIIGPAIQAKLRNQPRSTWTYLDYTFYGGPSGGFNLGVLNGLAMPGELSEGSFHDYFPETRRLMNNSYRKMEAYALRNSFMQYYGVPADTLGIIAGLQVDPAAGKLLNLSRVRLVPGNRVYTGDTYNNGFYMFDNLPPGPYTLYFETPGYTPDSVQVTVGTGATAFVDRSFVSFAAPTIITSSPVKNDPAFPAPNPIVVNFSKPMDTASVRSAFSITPPVAGAFLWSNGNAKLTFDPDSILPVAVTFTVRLDTSARSAGGQMLDGNGDGTPGDPFVLSFTTKYVDVFPPVFLSRFPGSADTLRTPASYINMTFDEPLGASSVNISNFVLQQIGSSIQTRTLEYREENGRGGVVMYLPNGLLPGASYRARVSRVADVLGNAMPTSVSYMWDFAVAPGSFTYQAIDSVNPGSTALLQPSEGTGTVGAYSVTLLASTARAVGSVSSNPGSASLQFTWDTTATSWLIRVPIDSLSAGGGLRWQKGGHLIRAAVYGDAGQQQVRFALGEGPAREVNQWRTIDWVGWRNVEWDLETDSLGSGTGDGVLDGELRFDAMEFRYLPGSSKRTGQIYIDQVELVEKGVTAVEPEAGSLPTAFVLHPNYPNPFNPSTRLSYDLAAAGSVTLTVYDLLGREVRRLVNGQQSAGRHTVEWDGSGVAAKTSSGVYIARLHVTRETGVTVYSASLKLLMMK
jgi:N-acetylmuramoyl-L-alanine amidase